MRHVLTRAGSSESLRSERVRSLRGATCSTRRLLAEAVNARLVADEAQLIETRIMRTLLDKNDASSSDPGELATQVLRFVRCQSSLWRLVPALSALGAAADSVSARCPDNLWPITSSDGSLAVDCARAAIVSRGSDPPGAHRLAALARDLPTIDARRVVSDLYRIALEPDVRASSVGRGLDSQPRIDGVDLGAYELAIAVILRAAGARR